MVKKLFIVPYESYNEKVMRTIKNSTKKYNKICYISLNKTCSNMVEVLKKDKVDMKKFHFIDSITPSLFRIKEQKKWEFQAETP